MLMKIILRIKSLTKTIILQNLLFSKNTNSKQYFTQQHLSQINKKPIRTSKALEFKFKKLKFFSLSKPTWKTTSSILEKKKTLDQVPQASLPRKWETSAKIQR